MKDDDQLMLVLGHPQQRQVLPDASRRQCVALLGRMLLAAIKTQPGNNTDER